MEHVYIAGHGRTVTNQTFNLPGNVSVQFAVWQQYNGSSSLSRYILNGEHDIWMDVIAPGNACHEHYLTPGMGWVLTTKAKHFEEGFGGEVDCHLLQCRGKNTLTLSGIITYLNNELNGADYTVYWTCCRSVVGQASLGRVEATGPFRVIHAYRPNRRVTGMPDVEKNGNIARVVTQNNATFVRADYTRLTAPRTWLGVTQV